MSEVDPIGAEAPCVENRHKPMTGARLEMCLLIIGWTKAELARRTGEHNTTIFRWLSGKASVDPDVAVWLEKLAAVVGQHPSPRRRGRPSFK